MFTVICHPGEDDISIFAPFTSEREAQAFIDSINNPGENNVCPNEHYIIEAISPQPWSK